MYNDADECDCPVCQGEESYSDDTYENHHTGVVSDDSGTFANEVQGESQYAPVEAVHSRASPKSVDTSSRDLAGGFGSAESAMLWASESQRVSATSLNTSVPTTMIRKCKGTVSVLATRIMAFLNISPEFKGASSKDKSVLVTEKRASIRVFYKGTHLLIDMFESLTDFSQQFFGMSHVDTLEDTNKYQRMSSSRGVYVRVDLTTSIGKQAFLVESLMELLPDMDRPFSSEQLQVLMMYGTKDRAGNVILKESALRVPVTSKGTLVKELYPDLAVDEFIRGYFTSTEPILVLFGDPGTGKTSFTKILIQELSRLDLQRRREEAARTGGG